LAVQIDTKRARFITQTGIDVAEGRVLVSEIKGLIQAFTIDANERDQVFYLIIREAERHIRNHSISKVYFRSSILGLFLALVMVIGIWIALSEIELLSLKLLVALYVLMLTGIAMLLYSLLRLIIYFLVKGKNRKKVPNLIDLDQLPGLKNRDKSKEKIDFEMWFKISPYE